MEQYWLLSLEQTSACLWSNSLAQSRMFWATTTWVLSNSKDWDPTITLSNPLLCLTNLTIKVFLLVHGNSQVWMYGHCLLSSLRITERVWLHLLYLPTRYWSTTAKISCLLHRLNNPISQPLPAGQTIQAHNHPHSPSLDLLQ